MVQVIRDEPERDDTPTGRRRRWLILCSGKRPFESRALANEVNRRRSKKGTPGDVYKCKSCGKYHIGSQEWAPKGRKRFHGKVTD